MASFTPMEKERNKHHTIVDSTTVILSDKLYKDRYVYLDNGKSSLVGYKFRNTDKCAEWRSSSFKYSYPFCFNYLRQLNPISRERVMKNVTKVCISIELVSDVPISNCNWIIPECTVGFSSTEEKIIIDRIFSTQYHAVLEKVVNHPPTNYDGNKTIAFYVDLNPLPANITLNWKIQFIATKEHTFYFGKWQRQRILEKYANVSFTFTECGFKRKQRLLMEELKTISVEELDNFFE